MEDYCVLCAQLLDDQVDPDDPCVETSFGPMHRSCADSDPDTLGYYDEAPS